jgi:hypothetical protein
MIEVKEGVYICIPCKISLHDCVYRPTEFFPDPNTDMVENPDIVINGVSTKETLKELEDAYEALGKAIRLMKEMVE